MELNFDKSFIATLKVFLNIAETADFEKQVDYGVFRDSVEGVGYTENITKDEKQLAIHYVKEALNATKVCAYITRNPQKFVYDDSYYWADRRNALEKAKLYLEQIECRYKL